MFSQRGRRRQEGDGEAGRRKKRKNPRIGSVEPVQWAGSWNSSSCHIRTEEKCFMYSIITKCSACRFPTLFASIYWFANASLLRAGEIFAFKTKNCFIFEGHKNKTSMCWKSKKKKKWYSHLKAFFTETKKASTTHNFARGSLNEGPVHSAPVLQIYVRNTVPSAQRWCGGRQDFRARRWLPGEPPEHSSPAESRFLQAKPGGGKFVDVKVLVNLFLF